MSKEVAIRVKGVSKNFRLPHERAGSVKTLFMNPFKKGTHELEIQHALHKISFEINKGEFFGIVGRNGSGKSTLLKMLAGIYQPSSGSIQTAGKLVPFIELGVGFNPELSGRENVYLNGALLGFDTNEIDQMYDSIVEFAELERFMDQKLKNYSSGMQVRLAFSMAVRAKADILLIDEVLAVGDADFQRKCFDYFKSLKRDKKTVVFVSHDMGAVREYCDRVALIDNGELAALGDAEEVAKKYTQLFAHDKSGEKVNVQAKRWGNGRANFDKVRIEQDTKHVVIRTSVKADMEIQDPTYGFMISSDSGQPILGTNSQIIQAKVKPLLAGRVTEVAWEIPNIFNDGRHNLELVLMYDSVTVVADWWEGASSFRVNNDRKTPYIVNPPVEFKSKEI